MLHDDREAEHARLRVAHLRGGVRGGGGHGPLQRPLVGAADVVGDAQAAVLADGGVKAQQVLEVEAVDAHVVEVGVAGPDGGAGVLLEGGLRVGPEVAQREVPLAPLGGEAAGHLAVPGGVVDDALLVGQYRDSGQHAVVRGGAVQWHGGDGHLETVDVALENVGEYMKFSVVQTVGRQGFTELAVYVLTEVELRCTSCVNMCAN